MKLKITPALLFLSVISTQAKALKPNIHNLCQPIETIIFSCSMKNEKLLSICAKASKIEYRFGKSNQLDLTLPKTKEDSISYNTVMYSGGGGAYVRFKHADTDYIVFSTFVKGQGDSSGVLIQKKGKKLSKLLCNTKSNVDFSTLKNLQVNQEPSDTDPLIDE